MFRKRIEIICRGLGALFLYGTLIPLTAEPAGIGRLWTTQAFPVTVESDSRARPLPPLPGMDGGNGGEAEVHEGFQVELSPSYFWSPHDGLRIRSIAAARRVSRHAPGLGGGFSLLHAETPETRWRPRADAGGWMAGAARWNTRIDGNTEISLGNSELASAVWNDSLKLSGLSLSQRFEAGGSDDARWNYSLALGAVDQSATGANDLEFGPTAGALALTYDHSDRLSLGARSEVASELYMTGISSQYDLGPLGRWGSAVARSNRGRDEGWRYRAMADFDLGDDLTLGWMGERHTDGFMDVSRHVAGAGPAGAARQHWSASWDVGRWGQWTGSFETRRDRDGVQQRRLGLRQQFWYTPRLSIGIHAEREVVSDDYDIGLRFSFPLY